MIGKTFQFLKIPSTTHLECNIVLKNSNVELFNCSKQFLKGYDFFRKFFKSRKKDLS